MTDRLSLYDDEQLDDARCPDPPSPEEIRERCEAEQAKWDRREKAKRAGREAGWRPPVCAVAEIGRD